MNCIPSSHPSPHESGGATLCGALIFPRISPLRTKGAMEARITQCPGLSTAPSWIILRRKGKLGLHRVSPHHKKRSSWLRFASDFLLDCVTHEPWNERRVFRFSLSPRRHEWGESRREGQREKRATSPRPSPPFGEEREGQNPVLRRLMATIRVQALEVFPTHARSN